MSWLLTLSWLLTYSCHGTTIVTTDSAIVASEHHLFTNYTAGNEVQCSQYNNIMSTTITYQIKSIQIKIYLKLAM